MTTRIVDANGQTRGGNEQPLTIAEALYELMCHILAPMRLATTGIDVTIKEVDSSRVDIVMRLADFECYYRFLWTTEFDNRGGCFLEAIMHWALIHPECCEGDVYAFFVNRNNSKDL